MSIPFEPQLAGWTINVHLILEYVAFFLGYRYYVFLKKQTTDPIPSANRLTIILGASLGALLGSRVVGFLENPLVDFSNVSLLVLFNVKTIMGGLFGGLLGVETAKRIIGEKQSSGDLFTLPIIVGIFIGRIGCFLSGTNEFTYGTTTTFITGMNLGDGLKRHPLALYELVFLAILFLALHRLYRRKKMPNGLLFKLFMLCYFGFRFLLEFIKPNVFFFLGLSTIQWLCVICFLYYRRTLTTLSHANPKVYLL
ncbi:prolipoprotein diacylglyceryl transferase [Chryseolinea lacunae]|uniref:Prolipoprotein diacylglyceryl transferase n=1 Tax=Chryseolinea lacunae TaxID=2801331 RepID=A0ABS1L140_9BACT|nr:prolipoprotein diacylglyceryl transferase family protein [Chryseolinea lacunae]MBL0745238.1 prolipoprotein diacylglyceryl transferase [Chryseolinea lacunae]